MVGYGLIRMLRFALFLYEHESNEMSDYYDNGSSNLRKPRGKKEQQRV
jgi:hypothetical protein